MSTIQDNKLKYCSYAFPKSGTALTDTTLESMLMHCLKLPKNGNKGEYGAVFVYNSNKVGEHRDDERSTGIILIDIDYITNEIVDKIYDNFELLSDTFNSLIAIQKSSSYYINPHKAGLHIYVKSDELSNIEHKKQSQICLAIFAQLVYKLLGIDLKEMQQKTGENILDFHNTSLYQRFNLFYSEFKYNEHAEKFNIDCVSYDDLEKLITKYNLQLTEVVTKIIEPRLNNIQSGKDKPKVKVDRHFKVGPFSGNTLRFLISIVADKYFGSNAQNFCDKYFYYERNKSIYCKTADDNTVHPLIVKWLIKEGYIEETHNNIITNWINEYSNMILKEIEKNKWLEIVAPTGTGKTTYINEFLARQLNAVVIVPFNVTNKLYRNLFEVNSNYNGEIPSNKPIVMVWDQAIKHWDKIKNRRLIIDEAHTLFFDRNYRNVAIELMNRIKTNNSKATFITATPAGEKEFFNMNQIIFYKKRDIINISIKATKKIEWSQYNYIKAAIDNNWYDRIVLLDDKTAKKIYEKFVIDGYGCEICYIRSSTKESQDFINLREKEILEKKINICTCVAFNGLNFKNTNENILVIGSIQLGETTSCEIIQQIGRIRNSKVTALYFYNPDKENIIDIENREIKAKEMNNIYINGVPDTFLKYDHRFLDSKFIEALKNIQEYQISHSTIDNIIDELSSTGYIRGQIKEILDNDQTYTMRLAIKRKESDELKNDIMNGKFENTEYKEEYKKIWAKDIRYLTTNPFYSGITLDTFRELISKGTNHKLIETYIENLKQIIRYLQVDEKEYQYTMDNKELYASMLSNQVDKRDFIKNLNNIKKMRNKYIAKIKFFDNTIYLSDVIKDVIAYEEQNQLALSNGGKNGSPKKKIKDVQTGIVYNSCSDCAKNIGHNISYISKHKDRFVKVD